MNVKLCWILAAVVLSAPSASAQSISNPKLYERVEETITNSTAFSNPFTDTELRLQVTAPSGRPLATSFTWYGFHDGDGSGGQTGNVWKFRLLFDHPGTWTVVAGFYVPGTNTSNGPSKSFTYTVSSTPAAGEYGHVYVDPQNWRRFRHADGTPWVPFVLHSSMLLERDYSESKRWVDEHVARGIDALSARFHAEVEPANVQSTGRWHYLLSSGARATTWPGAGAFDYDRFDVGTWRYSEQIIEYARTQDVKLSIWFGISGINRQYWSYGPKDYPNNSTLGPKQKLFIRYFLARWAPFTNWWHWTVDSEYEETGSGSLDRIRAYAAELRARNPWKTLITTHVLSNWSPGNSPEFDVATLQRRVADSNSGATACRSFVTGNDQYGIPVYNSEGVWELTNLTRTRVATWAHLMAGGFSHIAHFATNGNHRTSSWGITWSQLNARHKEDATEIGKTVAFFNRTPGIDINPCVPSNNLVSVSGGSLALCLADAGQSYYVWVDEGGTPSLDLSGVSGTFSVTRYRVSDLSNPATLADVSGGGTRSLGSTPTTGFGDEYLFVIKRSSGTGASLTVTSPNGGETWSAAGTATVTWTSSGSITNVRIELSTDGGSTYPTVLASSTPNDGSHAVSVPNLSTGQARVRVSDALSPSTSDASDANFSIQSTADTTPPSVSITDPSSDSQVFKGPITVSGTASDGSGVATVEWQLDSTAGAWTTAAGTSSWSLTIPTPADGGHTVYVRATDAATPSNTSAPVSRTFVSDNTSPSISGINAGPGSTAATVSWTTDEASDSRVQWGTSPGSYTGDTGVVQTGVTAHSVTLSGLSPNTTYYFIVQSADPFGNDAVSLEQSFQTGSGGGGLPTNTSPASYVWDLLDVGKPQYVDRAYTFSSVPAALVGLDYLQTVNDDKSSQGLPWITFDISQDVTVYVAHDDRISPKPSWMAGFVDTGMDLVSAGGGTFSLFAKDFPPGTVGLGGNIDSGSTSYSMYTVVVGPPTGSGTPDTDGDGLSDVDEVNLYGTNPLVADTDGDGMSDGAEVQYNLDPLNSDQDANGVLDGLDDWNGNSTNNQIDIANGINPGSPPLPPGPGPAPTGGGGSGGSGGCGALGLEALLALALLRVRRPR